MAGVLDNVNQRTQMVGQNRLEMLLFSLGAGQLYGINVFKVKEVLQCPKLTEVPKRDPVVRGVAYIRDATIPILDLRHAIGGLPLENLSGCFVIITEYNRTTQGFLVSSVERIVNMSWSDITPPPREAGSDHYLTAVTELEGRIIEILDVEKVLAELAPVQNDVPREMVDEIHCSSGVRKHVLIVDDSIIARRQIQKVVSSLGIETTLAKNGREAMDFLNALIAQNKNPNRELLMIISDIEMPEMDGYTFTDTLRSSANFKHLHVLLHTSLSGVFNEAMVRKVGADDFLAKFHPNELARRVTDRIAVLNDKRAF